MTKRDIQRFRKAIGAALRDVREAAGLSQEFVADLLKIPRTNVIRYEQGKHTMNWIRFAQICQIIGADAGATLNEVLAKVNGRK